MPARISIIRELGDAERYFGDGAQLAGALPRRLANTLHDLAEYLPATTTLHIALDAAGEYFAAGEDSERHYPLGEVFALREDGSLGHGDVNQPIYFPDVVEFLNSQHT